MQSNFAALYFKCVIFCMLKADKSELLFLAKGLFTNYAEGWGYKMGGGGGQVKFHPYGKKRGGRAEQVLAILKWGGGGHKRFWGSFIVGA